MPNLNAKQIVLIILAMIGFTATGIQQLEPVIGVVAVKAVASICTFIGGLMAAALAPFLSNASVVKDAGSLTGVEVQVHRTATPSIAALAVAEVDNGVAPAPGESVALARLAEGVSP